MPALDNVRHEAFAHFIAEGDYQSHAYKKAGYGGKEENHAVQASVLVRNPKVAARIREIVNERFAAEEENVRKHVITPQLVIGKLRDQADLALKRGKEEVFVSCWREIAKLAGLHKSSDGHAGLVQFIVNAQPSPEAQQAAREALSKKDG